MTPEQKIKRDIVLQIIEGGYFPSQEITADNIDSVYSEASDEDGVGYEEEFRSSGIDTAIKCDWSRHYESKSVATKLSCGTWVGWTYWYGGGKHGQPESIDWMDSSYELEVTEKEVMTTVREFTKKEGA